jgi:hypothetical protein
MEAAEKGIEGTHSQDELHDLIEKAQQRLQQLRSRASKKVAQVRCTLCGAKDWPMAYATRDKERPKYQQENVFRGLDQFNSAEGRIVAGKKHRLVKSEGFEHPTKRMVAVEIWFPNTSTNSLLDKLAVALATVQCINIKEFLE